MNAAHAGSAPQALRITAADGYVLGASLWRHPAPAEPPRPIVIINPATSVRARYYARFATWLHQHGFDVLSYDYRGIGESRPPSLRGFSAGWIDWGRLDFEAALQWALHQHPDQPIHVVGHSVGGFLVGLAASSKHIRRVFTMGAQFAYWRDYAPQRRLGLLLKWHVAMPALTRVCNYFPGQRLGWLEDTPKGVVRDWIRPAPTVRELWHRGSARLSDAEIDAISHRFAAMTGPTLALSLSDDEFGTPAAIRRLLAHFPRSPATHWQVQPQDLGLTEIGHFAYFHSRFEHSLWPIALDWLQDGQLRADRPGRLLPTPS